MMEAFFGFKKSPFGDHPDGKQLFASQAYAEAKTRLQFLADHHGAGLLTGEVGGSLRGSGSYSKEIFRSLTYC